MKTKLLTIILVALGFSAAAQIEGEYIALYGVRPGKFRPIRNLSPSNVVTDDDNKPLQGVKITVKQKDTVVNEQITTESGVFDDKQILRLSKKGALEVTFAAEGYLPKVFIIPKKTKFYLFNVKLQKLINK